MLEESKRLVCAEHGAASDEQARGWQATPVSDDEELPLRDDDVAVFCPACASQEFGNP